MSVMVSYFVNTQCISTVNNNNNNAVQLIQFIFRHTIYAVPRTELIGDSDRYVKAGSTVNLRCIIRGAIEPPLYIIWYHDAQQILPDNKYGYQMQMVKNSGGVGGNGFDGNGLAGGNGDGQQSAASLYDASSMDSQNTVRETHPLKCICVVTMAATTQKTHRSRYNYSFLCVA